MINIVSQAYKPTKNQITYNNWRKPDIFSLDNRVPNNTLSFSGLQSNPIGKTIADYISMINGVFKAADDSRNIKNTIPVTDEKAEDILNSFCSHKNGELFESGLMMLKKIVVPFPDEKHKQDVFYHATSDTGARKIRLFNFKIVRDNTTVNPYEELGYAVYFTPDKQSATIWGNNIFKVKLNTDNLMFINYKDWQDFLPRFNHLIQTYSESKGLVKSESRVLHNTVLKMYFETMQCNGKKCDAVFMNGMTCFDKNPQVAVFNPSIIRVLKMD